MWGRRLAFGSGSGPIKICELMRQTFPGKERERRVCPGKDTARAEAGGRYVGPLEEGEHSLQLQYEEVTGELDEELK